MAHLFKIGDKCRARWLNGMLSDYVVTIVEFKHTPKAEVKNSIGQTPVVDGNCIVELNGRRGYGHTDYLEPIQRRGDKLTAYDTTATDEATKAMLKAMAGCEYA